MLAYLGCQSNRVLLRRLRHLHCMESTQPSESCPPKVAAQCRRHVRGGQHGRHRSPSHARGGRRGATDQPLGAAEDGPGSRRASTPARGRQTSKDLQRRGMECARPMIRAEDGVGDRTYHFDGRTCPSSLAPTPRNGIDASPGLANSQAQNARSPVHAAALTGRPRRDH